MTPQEAIEKVREALEIIRPTEMNKHLEEYDLCDDAIQALTVIEQNMLPEWQPIENYDYQRFPEVELAAYIVPSETAQKNGSRPYWTYDFGRCWHVNTRKFTGILGGSPSHFRPMRERTPPREAINNAIKQVEG